MTLGLIILLSLLSYFDIKYKLIPNVVTLPLILIGCLFTGYWLEMIGAFTLMLILYSENMFAGGDVKLMAMLAAFIGSGIFPVIGLSIGMLILYRFYKQGPTPFAPFVLAGYTILAIFGHS